MCTGNGYVERELLSLCSRERGYLFRARFALLSKVVVLVALLCATVKSSKGLVGPRELRSRGPINDHGTQYPRRGSGAGW